MHCRQALELRLQRQRLLAREHHQILRAIGSGLGNDGPELLNLGRPGGHEQFAAAAVRNAALGRVRIQKGPAFNAQTRLQGALRVINAGVNNLAVARTRAGANRISRFKHPHLAPLQSQRTGHRQTHHTRTNDHRVYLIHDLCLSFIFLLVHHWPRPQWPTPCKRMIFPYSRRPTGWLARQRPKSAGAAALRPAGRKPLLRPKAAACPTGLGLADRQPRHGHVRKINRSVVG